MIVATSGVTPPRVVINARVGKRPTITGVERWAVELIPRLRELAPERYVVAAPPSRASSGPPGHAWEQLALPAYAARAHAELIFSPANTAPILWPGNAMMLHDAAVLREPGAYNRSYRIWHQHFGIRCARRALRVLTVSEFSRRELVELAGLAADRVVVVHGGVDRRFSANADHERVSDKLGLHSPYVLTVATRDRRKNLGVLADTGEALAKLGIELVWAGDARPQFGRDEPLAAIRPLGWVQDADLPGLYAGASAFVLPSRYEGLGLPCLEAMASGTPVVAADRAALPETCGDAALLVDPDDPKAVADAVIRAVTEPLTAERLRAAGLARAAERTWESAALQIDSLLNTLQGAASG